MPLSWTAFNALDSDLNVPPLSGGQADGDAHKSVLRWDRQNGERTSTVHMEASFPGAQVSCAAAQPQPAAPGVWTNTHTLQDVLTYPGVQPGIPPGHLYDQRLDQQRFDNRGQGHGSSPHHSTTLPSHQQVNLQQPLTADRGSAGHTGVSRCSPDDAAAAAATAAAVAAAAAAAAAS